MKIHRLEPEFDQTCAMKIQRFEFGQHVQMKPHRLIPEFVQVKVERFESEFCQSNEMKVQSETVDKKMDDFISNGFQWKTEDFASKSELDYSDVSDLEDIYSDTSDIEHEDDKIYSDISDDDTGGLNEKKPTIKTETDSIVDFKIECHETKVKKDRKLKCNVRYSPLILDS